MTIVNLKEVFKSAIGQDENTLFSCLRAGTNAVTAAVKDRIKILGSVDKA